MVVFGLGLIGQMAVQLLRASGCNVIGIDLDRQKLALAEKFGARAIDPTSGQDPVKAAMTYTNGMGIDGVLITASAKEDSIVKQSAQMSRQRGRIVLVGVVNLDLDRSDFYEKELQFQVSCSYGPGRYDPLYENKGQDYPYGLVRWTEKRNFEAVLDSLASGALDVSTMISERIPLDQANRDSMHNNSAMANPHIIFDNDRLAHTALSQSRRRSHNVKPMIATHNSDTSGYQNVITNS